MTKRTSAPPFPDSPGAWLACFRHRLQVCGHAVSPEHFGRLIGKSGATIRRWEANLKTPDENEIALMAHACELSAQQVAFLSAACSRMRAMPAPNAGAFRNYMTEQLCSTPYPAMILDGLFYIRGWNSYLDAVVGRAEDVFEQGLHPMAMLLRSRSPFLTVPEQEQVLRDGLRIFWMSTAVHSHRPEYAAMLADLDREPQFRAQWLDLALGRCAPEAPISFAHTLGDQRPRFRVYSRTISFPPTYHLNEYQPDDEPSRRRLEVVKERGPPRARFRRELHWVHPQNPC